VRVVTRLQPTDADHVARREEQQDKTRGTRRTGRPIDIQQQTETERQTDRQTDRQLETETETETENACCCRSVVSIDEASGSVFFIGGDPEAPTQRTLYSVSLHPNTATTPERLTPESDPGGGTHGYMIAPGGLWAVHTSSSFGMP
jgi:hypothetical protein